jgi:hypothetical protein
MGIAYSTHGSENKCVYVTVHVINNRELYKISGKCKKFCGRQQSCPNKNINLM